MPTHTNACTINQAYMVTNRNLWNVFVKVNLASICIAESHYPPKIINP